MTTIVGVDCHSYFRVVAQGAGNTLYGTSTTHSVNMWPVVHTGLHSMYLSTS